MLEEIIDNAIETEYSLYLKIAVIDEILECLNDKSEIKRIIRNLKKQRDEYAEEFGGEEDV